MKTEDTISILNGLIETLKDGQEGFRVAAEDVKSAELKTLFSRISLERSRMAGELQQEAVRLGEGEPEKTSSAAGALHRGWIHIKEALAGGGEHAVLSECERGEDSAVSAYRDALEAELPQNLREIIEQQYTRVKAAHDEVRERRDAVAK
jgi:uncharacterized protein (TIGR02284 family)